MSIRIKQFFSKIFTYYKVKASVLVHLFWIYPSKYKGSKILSIIPKQLLIGNDVIIERNVIIDNQLTMIGNHTIIVDRTMITNCTEIGSFCSISMDVKIGLAAHPSDYVSTSPLFYAARRRWTKESTYDEQKGKLTYIGHDVLISANSCILNGVSIGTGAIIGAGAIVTKDVPPYAIVAGVPSKIIRFRFSSEIIEELLNSKWWEKSDSHLKSVAYLSHNPSLFCNELKKLNLL